MSDKISVREAIMSDAEVIEDFQVAMALETENLKLDSEIVKKGVSSVFNEDKGACYYVACKDDEIVGMLMITNEWSDWRNSWVWWIQSVYTKPGYRGMGVYKTLYDYIKEIVIQRGDVSGIRLYVDKRNVRAQAVYDSLGMTGDHYATYEWMKI
jgi:ribosomal protein S18 acetylase RimI-like enzyme